MQFPSFRKKDEIERKQRRDRECEKQTRTLKDRDWGRKCRGPERRRKRMNT